MVNAKLNITLIISHFKLSTSDSPLMNEEKKEMEKVPYASVVNSLMYLIICIRSNIVYGATLVSYYMANMVKHHKEAVKWVMRYLRDTTRVGLLCDHS